jgi:hypothetical protein
MPQTTKLSTLELREIARDLRLDILDMTSKAGSWSPSSLVASCATAATIPNGRNGIASS